MTEFDAHYALRDDLVRALEQDLVGPGDDDAPLHDAPLTAYIAGVLHPADAGALDPAEDRDLPEDETSDGGQPEMPTALASVRLPSSLGITFSVDTSRSNTIVARIDGAKYVPAKQGADGPAPLTESEISQAGRGDLLTGRWLRRDLRPGPVEIPVTASDSGRPRVADGLTLYWRVRRDEILQTAAVTLALVNDLSAGSPVKDMDARYQCGITVTSPDGDVFVERRADAVEGLDDQDLFAYRLLYRHAKTFAIGHGCGARWEGDSPDSKRLVATTCVPTARVRVAESNPELTSPVLSLKRAAEMPKAKLLSHLRDFIGGYEGWIRARADEAEQLEDPDLVGTARIHLARCSDVVERVQAGIHLLERDADALLAFRLMNEAMLEQRARTDWLRAGRQGERVLDERPEWRPFQLAFILLCLNGIADERASDRDIADLLWFPTGGGKTEAYLGLIAFTVFLRRLRDRGAGVTVLMRYTLRLLTIQQFARAALLICCCEQLRRDRDDLGDDEIAIGLWIGEAGTPNRRKDAANAVKRLKAGAAPLKGNPKQLQSCPWCGRLLDSTHYWMGDFPPRLAIGCRGPDCEFGKGLPVLLIDEDIYDYRPTLIVATSDKFASMPWRDECRSLFNFDSDDAPPELVIQDELHLISGPLGTLAGLYETAVDLLCESRGPKPKVIASTATIRRADDQTKALFDRRMFQFPPAGIDARDSYFAVEASPERRGDRCYVGCFAPASSHATLMIRVYARLLQSMQEADAPDEVRDAYWTLLGYFNSLRVLGAAMLQVQDDVVDRVRLLARDDGANGAARATEDEAIDMIEMTSRVESGEIPRYLALMEKSLPDAVDVVLATNMISVGVDIDRLGLMVVMGQPQSTSEYIQATSRVGRRHPGLVGVLFNAMRSRDRSHYEGFSGYHGALYRQVESTSVTPFSSRARDRALHAVLVAIARLTVPGLGTNSGAGAIGHHVDAVRAIRDRIVERVSNTMPDEAARTREELDGVIEMWRARAEADPDLVYSDWERPTRSLLVDALKGDEAQGAFPTLFSLRDVDAESPLQLVRR